MAFHHPTLVAERVAEDRELMLNEVLETALAGLKPITGNPQNEDK